MPLSYSLVCLTLLGPLLYYIHQTQNNSVVKLLPCSVSYLLRAPAIFSSHLVDSSINSRECWRTWAQTSMASETMAPPMRPMAKRANSCHFHSSLSFSYLSDFKVASMLLLPSSQSSFYTVPSSSSSSPAKMSAPPSFGPLLRGCRLPSLASHNSSSTSTLRSSSYLSVLGSDFVSSEESVLASSPSSLSFVSSSFSSFLGF